MKKLKDKIFNGLIWSFLALYLCTASISFFHCIEFCSVGNPIVLSVIMSFAFEVGLALTLFSILITDENKNSVVSWILMSVLTCVQVMGNIYSVEKYMELSNNNFYMYIQNGFLHWFTEDMPERDIMSIIAILLGALLPLVALLMTDMVAKNLKNRMREKEEEKTQDPKIEEDDKKTDAPAEVETVEPKAEDNEEKADEPEVVETETAEPKKEEKEVQPLKDVKNEDETPIFIEKPKDDASVKPEKHRLEPNVNEIVDEPLLNFDSEGYKREKETALSELVAKAKDLAAERNAREIIDVKPEVEVNEPNRPNRPLNINLFNPVTV